MKYSIAKEILDDLRTVHEKIMYYRTDLVDHPLLVKAQEAGSEATMEIIAEALYTAASAIGEAFNKIEKVAMPADGEIDEESLEEMVLLAEEFDKSGDPLLMKQASVLDQILLTLAAPRGAKDAFKQAEDKEVNRLRDKYRSSDRDKQYKSVKEEQDKDMKVADAVKAIDNSIKEYRPMEAPLSTRTCPDHPGAQISRVGEDTYQCELDKKVYNYKGGFTTMKGNKIPGGDVSAQTQALGDRAIEHMSFDTRESKLNP